MLNTSIADVRHFLHAQLCYQLFITPIYIPIEKEYRPFAERACEYFDDKRTEDIHLYHPRHHIVHRFAQPQNPKAKRVLIVHGWMSRAAYMIGLTHVLHQRGYEVFTPDLPAHGETKGYQLTWTDAILVVKNLINNYGPFDAVIGHSYGGSMLLNALNLDGQLAAWKLDSIPKRYILLAAPTRMRSPVHLLARRYGLSGRGYQLLRRFIYQKADMDPNLVRIKQFIQQKREVPFLCVHGEDDKLVPPIESEAFCREYPHAELEILSGVDHVNILMDKRVEKRILSFLEP